MKVLIMTDLEGISGVDRMEQISVVPSEGNNFAIRRLMADLNACVEGCLEAGADEVNVADGHGSGKNFDLSLLHPAAVYRGIGEWQDCIISGTCDAYLEIGCHAMPGTLNGFLDHCQSSARWYNYLVNGRPAGEIAQGAMFAGAYDVPMVMVSGDTAACMEARAFLGNIETADVKTGIGRNFARCIPLEEAENRIRNAARIGVQRRKGIRPFKPLMPLTLTLQLYRSDMADDYMERHPEYERLDARTIRKVVNRICTYKDVQF